MRYKKRRMLSKTNLLDLPNCLILQLVSYLDATSLYLLSRTCERLDDLIKDHTSLWKHIDARRAPNDTDKVAYCLDRGHNDTHTFLIRADNPTEVIVTEDFFTKLNSLKNLTVVALENQTINGGLFTMTAFPQQLQELSLKRSNVINTLEFFRFSGDHMKNLRVLILDGCDWVTSRAFIPISKYKNLEILSVYKCRNIENSIPYLSLSGQYGFKQLKIFDARLSPLGNTLLRSLYRSGSLIAIYLQNEDISYKLDYFKRKLHILKGAPTRDYYVEDGEFDLNDSLINEEDGLNYEDSASLDDKGLLDYLSTTSEQNKSYLPRSYLYTDPYNRCTCGYEEPQKGKKKKIDNKKKSSPKSSDSDDSDDDDDDKSNAKGALISELEEKIEKLASMVHRSQVSNGWSRGLSNSRDALATTSIRSGEDIEEFVRISADKYYRWQLLKQNEIDAEAPLDKPVIEIHLNLRKRRLETFLKTDKTQNGQEPEIKKQKTEDPIPGPSGLNNHKNDDSDSDFEDQQEPPTPEAPLNNEESVENEEEGLEAPEPPAPPADILVGAENAGNVRARLLDMNTVRIEQFDNVAKENYIPLKRLSLRGYKRITDVVLYYIKDLELELLDLTYTNVTVDGINNYLIDHPSCRIVHEKFCACPTNLHF